MAISAAFLRSALPAVVASKGSGAPSLTGAAAAAAQVAFSAAPARYSPLASVVATRGAGAVPGRARRRHPVRCESSPTPPAEVKEPLNLWEKTVKALKGATENATWKSFATLILLIGCTVLGYFAKKENQQALFIIDVLDKSNKAYKTTLEFAILIIAVIISLGR